MKINHLKDICLIFLQKLVFIHSISQGSKSKVKMQNKYYRPASASSPGALTLTFCAVYFFQFLKVKYVMYNMFDLILVKITLSIGNCLIASAPLILQTSSKHFLCPIIIFVFFPQTLFNLQ